ncbi:MAG: hypothetical protein JWL95_406, partial [Gemmatimonadetes bacterium]|nr:hypothetical protein [Gemmatimonadota bacterium]
MRYVAFWQPMRRRLPLLICVLLCGAIGALTALTYRHLASALIESAKVRVASVSARLAASFAESEDRVRLDKRLLAADSAFARFLARPDSQSERQARQFLDLFRTSGERIVAAELWDRSGRKVLASVSDDFQAARLGGRSVSGGFPTQGAFGPFLARGDTVYLEARLPVVANGDTIAILRELQRLSDGRGGELVRGLIGSDAVMLLGNATGDIWTDLSRRLPAPPGWRAPGSSHLTVDPEGEGWVGSTAAVPRVPWIVWVALPRDAVLAPARALLREIALVELLILILGGVAAWLLSRHLTRPLEDVIAAVESIATGDYTRRLSNEGNDEVGRLASAFNLMSSHIEIATHDLESQQMELEAGNQELAEAVDRADRSAAELLAIVEGSPLAICTLDTSGLVRSWNPAAERMFGWNSIEVVNRRNPTIAASHLPEFDAHCRRLMAGEVLNGILTERRCKDGSTIRVSLSGAPLYDADGVLDGLLTIDEDVTDKHRMQAQLIAERKFLRQIIDLTPNFLFAKDREGRFTMVNQAFADAHGTTPEALVGKTDSAVRPDPAEVEAFRLADDEVFRSGATKVIDEEPITDAAGRVRWLHSVKRPIVGESGEIEQVLIVSTDITE